MDSDGKSADAALLTDKGFAVGMQVKRKSDGFEGTIKQMTPTNVLLMVGGVEKSASAESFLKSEWKEVVIKVDPVKIPDWSQKAPETNPYFFVEVLQGQILKEIWQKAKGQGNLALDIFAKPKNVVATRDFKLGQLKIPVTTMRLDIRGDDKVPANGICVGKSSKDWCQFIVCFEIDNWFGWLTS